MGPTRDLALLTTASQASQRSTGGDPIGLATCRAVGLAKAEARQRSTCLVDQLAFACSFIPF